MPRTAVLKSAAPLILSFSQGVQLKLSVLVPQPNFCVGHFA